MPALVAKENLGIGNVIHHFRKKQKMTLQELADKCGLSPSFLSLAERGKATPSIVSMINIAQALNVSIDNFLETPKRAKAVRTKEDPEYIDYGSPVTYIRLGSGLPGQKLDSMKIVIPAGFECPKARRDGESFYYILDGGITIIIDGTEYHLSEGDSAHVRPKQEYVLINDADTTTTLLWTGTPQLLYEDSSKS